MPRFQSSSTKDTVLKLRQKKKSLAEIVNDQFDPTQPDDWGDDNGFDGAVEDLHYEHDEDGYGEEDLPRTSSTKKAVSKKRGRDGKATGPLRHRGPLDEDLSTGRYAATAVDVEAAMDDLFGDLDMNDMEAEGEEMLSGDDDVDLDGMMMGEGSDEEDEDEEEGDHRGRRGTGKATRVKDLTEEEYAEWLDKSRKARRSTKKSSMSGISPDEAVMDGEEGNILAQLEDYRQANISLLKKADEKEEDAEGIARQQQIVKDAVRHWIMVYSQLLRLRVSMQPAVTKSICLPQFYALSSFLGASEEPQRKRKKTEKQAEASEVPHQVEIRELVQELRHDLGEVLVDLHRMATNHTNGTKKNSSSSVEPSFKEINAFHQRTTAAANTSLDFWGTKLLVSSSNAKLKAISQPLPKQIEAILTSKTRLRRKVQKNRSHLPILGHPSHTMAERSAEDKSKRALEIAEGDVDEEIYDDGEFVRELVRRGGNLSHMLEEQLKVMRDTLLPARESAKKGFHRITKGKAVSYEPRPKLVGFVVAEPFDSRGRHDLVASSLFQ